MRNGTSTCIALYYSSLAGAFCSCSTSYIYNDSINHHSVCGMHAGLFLPSFLKKRVEEKREVSYLTVSIHAGAV